MVSVGLKAPPGETVSQKNSETLKKWLKLKCVARVQSEAVNRGRSGLASVEIFLSETTERPHLPEHSLSLRVVLEDRNLPKIRLNFM